MSFVKVVAVLVFLCGLVSFAESGNGQTPEECFDQAYTTDNTLKACIDAGVNIQTYNMTEQCLSRAYHTAAQKRANLCVMEQTYKCSSLNWVDFLQLTAYAPLLVGYPFTPELAFELTCEHLLGPSNCVMAQLCTLKNSDVPDYDPSLSVFTNQANRLPKMLDYCTDRACVWSKRDTCRATVTLTMHIYLVTMVSIVPNVANMNEQTFFFYMNMVDDTCAHVDAISAQQTCIETQVETTTFQNCVGGFTGNIRTGSATTCEQMQGIRGCLAASVGDSCGAAAGRGLWTALYFADDKLPQDCYATCVGAALANTQSNATQCVNNGGQAFLSTLAQYDFSGECRARSTMTPARLAANKCLFGLSFQCSGFSDIGFFISLRDSLNEGELDDFTVTVDDAFEIACDFDVGTCDFESCWDVVKDVPDIRYDRRNAFFPHLGKSLPHMMAFCRALSCIENKMSTCPVSTPMIKHITMRKMMSIIPEVASMTSSDRTYYSQLITNTCAKEAMITPKESCVMDEIMSTAFENCVQPYKGTFGSGTATSCSNFNSVRGCFRNYIGENCNAEAVDGIITAARFMDNRLPRDSVCPVAGAPKLAVSIGLLLAALVYTFL